MSIIISMNNKNNNGWGDLGIVETIFEDDTEDLHSSLSSPPMSSPSSPLLSCVDAWTTATGRSPDVKITVQGISFQLHKEPLISKSSYLKRQLMGVSEFTLSPPLKITSDTFNQIADFCYTDHTVITPFNVAALRTAAEVLKMDGCDDDNSESLRQRTESYFGVVVAINREFTCSVFRSCLPLLPEAEQKVFLASRCLEALFMIDGDDDGEHDGIVSCAEELKTVSPENFKVIADSMQQRFTMSHDLLYRMVDLYFLVYNGKISEEEKTQICSTIDCNIISPSLLMHAVQNPRMPLRFIVQAMLIEQLNTHRSIFSALNSASTTTTRVPHQSSDSPATLGDILERDAALRQVAQLRAAIDTTSFKIQNLEMELSGMKKLLGTEGEIREKGRSSSCRFNTSNAGKVVRGERGSVSFRTGTGNRNSSASLENDRNNTGSGVVRRSLGQRFIRGLKVVFGGVSLAKKNEKVFQG